MNPTYATLCSTSLPRKNRSRSRDPAMDLASEALKEAQERYANGVSDNLAVSQAQQSVAQADSQYVVSLYRDNVAKLSLARALGDGQDYKKYLGGK
ncbi:MAG: TolC family protein [Terracidiphilus sp.]